MNKSTKKSFYSKGRVVLYLVLFIFVVLINAVTLYSGNTMAFQTQNSNPSKNILLEPVGKRASVDLASHSEISKPETQASPTPKEHFIPVLLYHKTPDNFEEQLLALKNKGYTTITMSELHNIVVNGQAGPAKPAAITFDDGFSDQLRAFELLKKYNMKATFYIIVGGQDSKWCIGTERKDTSCGDSYMGWSDIMKLKDSGLIEIGSHTIDHLSLINQGVAVQKDQIIRSKQILETKLNTKIYSFAYPYGHLNDTTIDIVKNSGYTNATGTAESSIVSISNIYSVPRVRSTLKLP